MAEILIVPYRNMANHYRTQQTAAIKFETFETKKIIYHESTIYLNYSSHNFPFEL